MVHLSKTWEEFSIFNYVMFFLNQSHFINSFNKKHGLFDFKTSYFLSK